MWGGGKRVIRRTEGEAVQTSAEFGMIFRSRE